MGSGIRVGFAFLLIAVSGYSSPQQTVGGELRAAALAEKAGNYAQAADHYRIVLTMQMASANLNASTEVRVRMATDLFMAHRYQDSLRSVNPVLDLKPGTTREGILSQAWVVAGLDDLQLNRLDSAIFKLRHALVLNPASGTARLALGDALARSGHLRQAVQEYHDQTQHTPKVVEAWYKMGVAEAQLAKETSNAFARSHTKDPVAEMLDAEQFLNREDGLGAAQILLRMIGAGKTSNGGLVARHENPQSTTLPGVHADLGQAFMEEEYVRAAGAEFRKEITIDPESAPAWFGMAETESLDSNWDAALSRVRHLMLYHPHELERRLELQPPSVLRAARHRGGLRVPANLGQTEEGRLWQSWLRGNGISGARIESTHPDSCPILSAHQASTPGLWLTEGCYARLIRQLQGRMSQHPTVSEKIKLIEADFRLSRFDDAQAGAELLLKSDPQCGWATYWLAQSAEALSFQSLLRASSLNPNSSRVHEMLARHDADHYLWKQAIAEYQTALRLAPNLTDLYFGLGTAYWQEGDWAQAQLTLLKTLEISPASTVAAYELGDTFVNERQWANAVPYLRKSIGDHGVERKARLDLAKAESELGQDRQAVAALVPVKQDDADGEIHFRLAALYRKMGELDKAHNALDESERLRQASDGMTVERTKETEQERAKLQQAAKQEPR